MIFGDDIVTALVAIQMGGEGGAEASIIPLTVTENGTYTAADYGCDGFDPVNVQVPDRYDEGYSQGHTDGYNEGHEVGYTEGYDAGLSDGYNDGYEFAYSYYNNVVDDSKEYTIVFYFTKGSNEYTFWCEIYNTADMSKITRFNYWPAPYGYRWNPKLINAWVEPELGKPVVEVETTDKSGGNKARYIYHFDRSQIYYARYFPSNTNIICKLPTE